MNEKRAIGALALDELAKLKKALQVFHARNPSERVAISQMVDGSVTVWRLR